MSPLDEEPTRGARAFKGLSRLAIARPLGTCAVAAMVLVIGLFASGRLAVNLLPEVVYPLLRVSVTYPGVAPTVMEEQVTRVLERQLSSTENLVLLRSEVVEGRADVSLVFDYGVDLDLALQDAARLLERARAQLPPDIESPRLRKWDPGSAAVFQAGFSSSARAPRDVRDWVENVLAPQLQSIAGVANVEAVGGQVREMEVVVDPQRLMNYGLSLGDVADRVATENRNIAAGSITAPGMDMLARTDGRFASAADIEQLLLSLPAGGSVRLGDLAQVRDGFQEQRVFVRLDGVPATQLSVYKQPDANTVRVIDDLAKRLSSLQASGFIPPDIQWRTTRDESFFVRGSVRAVAQAALLGGALALLIVLAFLGSLRKGLIIGLSIPIAVITTFAMMGFGGLTLNVMSLGGLALGVGLLLDNAIVMLENISRHQERLHKPPEQAAGDGADEVASAILAGTLTNLAAVTPFLLVLGFAALLFRELIITISFAVVASLAVALTLVPMLAAQFSKVKFRSGFNASRLFRGIDGGMTSLSDAYARGLHHVLRWRWAVVGVSSALLAGAVLVFNDLGTEFLPQLDNSELRVRVLLPRGATPQQTDAAARQVEAALREMPHVENVFSIAGGQLFGGVVSERAGRTLMDIRLAPASERPDWPVDRWVSEARERLYALDIADARIRVQPPRVRGLNFSVGGEDLDLLLTGDDLEVLAREAREVVRLIEDIPGLDNVEVAAAEQQPQLGVHVDRERAAALGVNVDQVGSALRDAITGATPTRFTSGQFDYNLRVRLPRAQVENPDQLYDIIVGNGAYGPVRLGDVATLEIEESPAEIQRQNQVRIQRVQGSFNTAVSDVATISAVMRERLADFEQRSDIALIYGGQAETVAESRRETKQVMMLAVFLVFAVLVVQYERLSNPLVIMLTAPFALIGATAALWLTDTAVSASAQLGLILLIGIVVNNAILLVEYIERGLRRGLKVHAAVVEAARIRLRPILMTVMTTMGGMLPLAIGMGSGAELMRPLAIAVIGGLGVSTLLTLVLAPCLFVIVRNGSDWLRHALTGRRSSDAQVAG
jgi:hydrophobe/amphiphile efflux-1 (HAE1) family protein